MSSLNRQKQILRTHMKAAHIYSQLSYAKRLKVGALLIKDNRILSLGFNGMPSGMDNKCEIPYVSGSGQSTPDMITKPEVVHAEANVIAFAAKNGVKTDGCSMVITHSPCYECSKLIIQSGIKAVYYDIEYRIKDGIEFLKKNNLIVEKI